LVAASILTIYATSESKIDNVAAKQQEVNLMLERGKVHLIGYRKVFLPPPLAAREWVVYSVCKRVSSTEFFFASCDCEHPGALVKQDTVRASMLRATRLTQVTPGVTTLSVTTSLVFRGKIPAKINNMIVVPRLTVSALAGLRSVVHRKKENEFDAGGEDAKVLGRLLAFDVGAKMRSKGVLCKSDTGLEDRLTLFMDRTSVLRGARVRYPWFQVLLFEALRNRVRPPAGTRKALEDFGEEDARKAGRGLALALIANVSAEAAVDEWVMTYPALRELEQQ
jgi:hypothetical protein